MSKSVRYKEATFWFNVMRFYEKKKHIVEKEFGSSTPLEVFRPQLEDT